MRFLKNKIAHALKRQQSASSPDKFKLLSEELPSPLISHNEPQPAKIEASENVFSNTRQLRSKKYSLGSPVSNSTATSTSYVNRNNNIDVKANKNIVKNYARAMVNFTLSDLALTFLYKMTADYGVDVCRFRKYIQENKEVITSIKTLRETLIWTREDSKEVRAYKKVFKSICELFVKEYSVNWIYTSKLADKWTHLRYRFKILRRVRNPEYFTYLEDFHKTR